MAVSSGCRFGHLYGLGLRVACGGVGVGIGICKPECLLASPAFFSLTAADGFSGRLLQTNEPYVTSFCQSSRTSFLWMNLMVLVPLMRPPTPFVRRPNSFADETDHSYNILGPS